MVLLLPLLFVFVAIPAGAATLILIYISETHPRWLWRKTLIPSSGSKSPEPAPTIPPAPIEPTKKQKKKEKAQAELKALREEMQPPANLPPPAPSTVSPEAQKMLTRAQKEGVDIEILGTEGDKVLIIKRGHISLVPRSTSKEIFGFYWKDNFYFIDPEHIREVPTKKTRRNKDGTRLVLRYYVLYCEPLDKEGRVRWDPRLEVIQTEEAADQYITACTFEGRFEFNRTVIIAMVIAAIFAIPLGLVLNGSLHLIPAVHVTWVPT